MLIDKHECRYDGRAFTLEEETETFVALIREAAMVICPYNPHLPATDNMYFGLRDELEGVLEAVHSSFPFSPLVVGGHRIGKTSFLKEIERRLDQSQHTRAVYIDLNSFPSNPKPSDLFYRIARAACYKLTGTKGKTGEIEALHDDSEGFEWLVNYIAKLADKEKVNRVVIMLDELEILKQSGWLTTVLRNFDAAITNSEMIDRKQGGRLAFLATARREDLEMELADFDIPVMRFQIVPLRALTREEFQGLIHESIKEAAHQLSYEQGDWIWNETGGHPYLVHWILFHLWEKHQGNLYLSQYEDVLEAIDYFFVRDKSFNRLYYKSFGTLEREIYWMLLESERPLSRQEIRSKLIMPGSRIELSFRLLVQSGMVRKDNDVYTWNGRMFKNWATEQGHYLREFAL